MICDCEKLIVRYTDIDECVSAPCQNKGVCVDGINVYTCKCPPGFNGINCHNSKSYYK